MTKQKKILKNQYRKYIVFTGMAFQMGITIGVFTLIGLWLDEKHPNDYSMYVAIFSLIGVFGALYTTIKQVIKLSDEEN